MKRIKRFTIVVFFLLYSYMWRLLVFVFFLINITAMVKTIINISSHLYNINIEYYRFSLQLYCSETGLSLNNKFHQIH